MATDGRLTWTEKQIKVAALIAQGKTFPELRALKFSKNMISRVSNALAKGEKPSAEDLEAAGTGTNSDSEPQIPEEPGAAGDGKRSLVAVTGSKGSPIVFWVEQKKISLDPFELHKQYSYYTALANKNGGITNSFSQVLTLAMQVLWVLLQDIPKDENMLKAIFYGAK